MYWLFLMQTLNEVCRWVLYTTKKPPNKANQESRSPISFSQVILSASWVEEMHCLILVLIFLVLLSCLFPPSLLPSRKPQSTIPSEVLMQIFLSGLAPLGCPDIPAAQELRSRKQYSTCWNQKFEYKTIIYFISFYSLTFVANDDFMKLLL